MEKLTSKLKRLKALAIIFTILFIIGVPTTIFGAINQIWYIFPVGVVFDIIGFYGMPIAWVFYFNNKNVKLTILNAVIKDNINSIDQIQAHVGLPKKLVIMGLQSLIRGGYLPGYQFNGEYILPKGTTLNQVGSIGVINGATCDNCGANVKFNGTSGVCPYCDTVVYPKNN